VTDSGGSSESTTLTVIVVGLDETPIVSTPVEEPVESVTQEKETPGAILEKTPEETTEEVAAVQATEEPEPEAAPKSATGFQEGRDELLESPFLEIGGQFADDQRQNIELPFIGPGQSLLQFLLNDSENEINRSATPTETFEHLRDEIESREDQLNIINSADFLRSISRMREEAITDAQETEAVVGGTFVFSASLSVGYVIWLVRSGILISSVISSLPAWRLIDPLPVLSSLGDSFAEEEDDESLESIVAGDHSAEKLQEAAESDAEELKVEEE
jgi:hypothetical protein